MPGIGHVCAEPVCILVVVLLCFPCSTGLCYPSYSPETDLFCVHTYIYPCGCAYAMMHIWKSGDNLCKTVLSYDIGARDRTQFVRLSGKHLYLAGQTLSSWGLYYDCSPDALIILVAYLQEVPALAGSLEICHWSKKTLKPKGVPESHKLVLSGAH